MLKHLFVTGTDTDVGKTLVSRALLQSLNAQGITAVGYKPVARNGKQTAEGLRNKDALLLQTASSLNTEYTDINPICIEEESYFAVAPQPDMYIRMSQGLKQLSDKSQTVVIEGSGGWHMLMSDQRPYSEWVSKEQLAVILVVGIKPDCVNHAILTAKAIVADGVQFVGWVANRINPCLSYYAETVRVLTQHLKAPLLGEIPYLSRPESREIGHYLNLSSLNG